MPVPTISLVAPASKTWLGVGRELNMGTAVLPVQTIPLLKNSYQPEDTYKWLHDEAIRGSMAMVFNDIQGVGDSTFSYGGPAFLDVEGYFLDNLFGDKSDTATGYTGTTTATLAAAIGGTSVICAAVTSFAVGQYAQVGIGSVAEIVGPLTIQAGTPGTIFFGNTPLRFPHGNGGTVYAVNSSTCGPFTHTWNILNNSSGQPPTHTFTDYTSLTSTVGARAYSGAAVGVIDITGNAEQLLEFKMTGNAWLSTPTTTAPTNTVSTAVPVPNWRSTVTVGSQVFDVGEWSVSLKRTLQVYWTDQGTVQNPYIIARGPLDATGMVNFTVPTDETPLLNMINNTQGTVTFAINNGVSATSTSYLALTVSASVAAMEKSKPSRSEVLVGYQNDFQCVANATNTGGSGGLGPITVVLTNNSPTY